MLGVHTHKLTLDSHSPMGFAPIEMDGTVGSRVIVFFFFFLMKPLNLWAKDQAVKGMRLTPFFIFGAYPD